MGRLYNFATREPNLAKNHSKGKDGTHFAEGGGLCPILPLEDISNCIKDDTDGQEPAQVPREWTETSRGSAAAWCPLSPSEDEPLTPFTPAMWAF